MKQQQHLKPKTQPQQTVKRPSARPQANPPQQETTLKKLIWQDGPKAPQAMLRGSIATDGTTVYYNGGGSTRVYQYYSDTQQWRTLPDLPYGSSTLVMADGKLTSVGGYYEGLILFSSKITNSLFSLTGEGRDRKWLEYFPPMPTKRFWVAAICHGRSLIVAGGSDSNRLATVEVLNMDTRLWSTASSLPHPFSQATISICGEKLYLFVSWDQDDQVTRSIFTCSISELLQTLHQSTIWQRAFQTLQTQSTIWRRIADAPFNLSSCATLCGQLVAVGGIDEAAKATAAVRAYNEHTNSWLAIEAMKTPRYLPLVASLHNKVMLVIGGSDGVKLDTVEIAKLS